MYIHVSGRPKIGEYSGLTNAQEFKIRRVKLKEKSSEKFRKRKWRENIRKDPLKHKKYKEDEKLRKWAAKNPSKKTKQAVRKWQFLKEVVKIFLLQITQLQIVACHFLANKHPIVTFEGLIYIYRKAQVKKLKLSKDFRQNKN